MHGRRNVWVNRVRRLLLVALVALGISTASLGRGQEVSAASYATKCVTTDPIGLAAQYTICAGIRWQDGRVYADWFNCTPNYFPGAQLVANINTSWCEVWNQGGGNGYGYLDVGANYQGCAILAWKGVAVYCGNYWERLRFYTDGRIEFLKSW